MRDIENSLSSLPREGSIEIRLPRNHQKNFFKDSWLTSLINNAAGKNSHLTIFDYTDEGIDALSERFARSLVGLMAAYMAERIENNRKEFISIDVHEMIEKIVFDDRGLFEQTEAGGKTFSFLSFDAAESDGKSVNAPRPMVLSAATKSEFIEKFLRIKREIIDKVFGLGPQISLFDDTFERERDLAILIYELYENTNQHGRYNERGELIKGIRSFNIKRHIGSKKDMLQQADSFEPLRHYLDCFEKGELKFYEISISDNGLGVINRFLASRPDYKSDAEFMGLSSLEKLNQIVDRSLSSKLFSGSGKGIRTALSNIRALHGFLTLRTNDCWTYYNGKVDDQSAQWKPVAQQVEFADIRGTSYNILLPVTNP